MNCSVATIAHELQCYHYITNCCSTPTITYELRFYPLASKQEVKPRRHSLFRPQVRFPPGIICSVLFMLF